MSKPMSKLCWKNIPIVPQRASSRIDWLCVAVWLGGMVIGIAFWWLVIARVAAIFHPGK